MTDLVSNVACPKCNHPGPHPMVLRNGGPHYADVRCAKCKLHWFATKPDSDPTKYKRPKAQTNLVKKFSRGFCEMCLRREDELTKPDTLEAQHVVEYQDGGDPTRENIWIVCTGCHRLIHWRRTYMGPREALRQRREAISSGALPQPEQMPDESDEAYLGRIVKHRQEELGK